MQEFVCQCIHIFVKGFALHADNHTTYLVSAIYKSVRLDNICQFKPLADDGGKGATHNQIRQERQIGGGRLGHARQRFPAGLSGYKRCANHVW